MKAILIQPPFTQLNAPYPAVHYLEAFLRGRGATAVSYDHSIELYRRVFSREGLAKVFGDARAALAVRAALDGGEGASRAGRDRPAMDEATRVQIERYLSYERLYIEWIDGIVDFLAGGDPAMAHRLASAAELPRGARAEAFLEERGGRIGPDEARALATRILDDLGDFIAYALDPDFGTVRYAERLASSRADFGEVLAALDDSWLIHEFYEPFLNEFWSARASESTLEPIDLILVTIPFPGCLLGALACGRSARKAFAAMKSGAGVAREPRVIFGGGYVSTELRGLRDTGIFDFCDYLSFDAGYGSLASIIEHEKAKRADTTGVGGISPLYRTMTRAEDNALIVAGFPEGDSTLFESSPMRILNNSARDEGYRRLEREAVIGTCPDYRSADFFSYLRVVDSGNPMHRLWSDTPWLKYSLAHGCYWRRCSFCDTELEYVADFVAAKTEAIIAAAGEASSRCGLHGIHFVDEAMPMAALLDFARANRARAFMKSPPAPKIARASSGARPFSFWGNVRFDSSWTQGRCEFLAASGLVAVSGGIEIATERGLAMTDKGFDLASLVRTLVAMRRAGLLVHAYLIYGFPGQLASDIVDSAEFCRQLFASGLVDSAFWHRFVLTRHSRMYRQWKDRKRPELKPLDRPWRFANNDLSFEGEAAFDRFDAPLAASLAAWMEGGDLEKTASSWFGRGSPKTSLAGDFVETLIASAEAELDAAPPSLKARAHWIAGLPAVGSAESGNASLTWAYRGELRTVELPRAVAEATRAALSAPSLSLAGIPYADLNAELRLPASAMAELLSAGLVVV
ncbi:MAG: radical SAM protein [Spirochaetales bacterium]|jgi:radical SAM superfamily enzyme YgiQ (UPF0313 family)